MKLIVHNTSYFTRNAGRIPGVNSSRMPGFQAMPFSNGSDARRVDFVYNNTSFFAVTGIALAASLPRSMFMQHVESSWTAMRKIKKMDYNEKLWEKKSSQQCLDQGKEHQVKTHD